jgi:hypothetical protein
MTTLRKRVTVLPGGVITLEWPDAPAGAEVDVTVVMRDDDADPVPLSELFGSGGKLFASKEEVDRFIAEEREAWFE